MKRAAAAAVGVFAVTCVPLMVGVTADGTLHRLRRYGNAMVLHGQVPYRDYSIEYPPGAIVFYGIPSLIAPHHHATVFRFIAALGWALVIVLLAYLVDRAWPLFFVALTPLALGPFSLMRFDAWPVVAVLAALIAQFRGRTTLAFSLLAVGALVKVWPLLLLPLFALYAWSKRALLAAAAILAVALVPFAAIAPQNAYKAFAWQTTSRHLELESIAASVLLVLQRPLEVSFDAGSWSVFGSGADTAGRLVSLAGIIGMALVIWLFARSERKPSDLLTAVTATVALITVSAIVLSPQFLLWMAPFVAFAPWTAVPFAGACLLTQLYFPSHFDVLIEKHGWPIGVLAVRNVLLLAVVVLTLRAVYLRAPARAPALTAPHG